MSDRPPHVFISYSHVDEAWKDRLVRQLRVLAHEGEIEMWHDRQIEAGDAWKTQIEQAIDRADVAVLLISAGFLTSKFIREEEVARILQHRASKGLRVIPVIVWPCAWMAVDWLKDIQVRPTDGRPLAAGAEHQIESDLAALALEIMEVPVPTPPPLLTLSARAGAFGLAILPTVLVGALVTLSMVMRVPTPLQLDMVARGVSLTVAGTDPVQLLNNSTVFSRLVIEGCDLVSFPALSIGLPDIAPVEAPDGVNFRCDAGVPGSKIVLRAIHDDPSQELGSLGGLMAHPGDQVSFEISGASPPDIRVEASRKASFSFSITNDMPFEIVSEFAEPEGIALPVDPDRVATYRALLDSSAERLATVAAGRGLNIVLVPARDADVEGLFRADVNIPLESVSLFQRSDVDDRIVSTAVSGTLTYPGRSDVDRVPIETGDVVTLRGLTGFRLTQLSVDRKNSGLGLSFRGQAAEVSTDGEDRRLTLFDLALFNRNLRILGIAAAFAFQWAWLRKYRWPAAGWR